MGFWKVFFAVILANATWSCVAASLATQGY